MHSSRMHTVRCSVRLWGGGGGGFLPRGGAVCLGVCVSVYGRGGVCPRGVCLGGCLPRGVCPGLFAQGVCLPRRGLFV